MVAYNNSTEQVAFAREQAAARSVEGRVRFVQDDYRNIDGRCDVFVSVGMLEHVGLARYFCPGRRFSFRQTCSSLATWASASVVAGVS